MLFKIAMIIDHLIIPFGRETGSKKEHSLTSLPLVFNWFPERSGPCDVLQYNETLIKSGVLLVPKIV